jgi:hypothetical protein
LGGEASAVDFQIAVGQGVEQAVQVGGGLVGEVAGVAFADAGLLADDDRARAFDEVEEFPVGHDHGAAGQEQPGRSRRGHARLGGDARLDLVAQLVDLGGEPHRIVVEADLVHEQGVAAGNGGRLGRAQLGQALQGLALGIDESDGLGQAPGGDGVAGEGFQGLLVADEFGPEEFPVVGRLALGHFHDVHGGVGGKGLVGLFLAVAGRLADDEVAGFDVGAKPGQLEADEGLDEVAGIAGQDGFGLFRAGLGPGAQADLDGPGGQGQLLGHEHAKGAHDLGPGISLMRRPWTSDRTKSRYSAPASRPSWDRKMSP